MSENIGDKKPTFGKRLRRFFIIISINLVVIVGIVCALSFWYAPDFLHRITEHDARVIVPKVTGFDAQEAIECLESQGLVPMVVDTLFSDGAQPGTVLDQLPECNMPVKPGRNVYLTINSYTTQQFEFPDVIQHSSRQARAELDDQFFVVDSVRFEPYEFDDLVLAVHATKTGKEMEIGQSYPKRTHVILVVGSTTIGIEAENDETESSFFE